MATDTSGVSGIAERYAIALYQLADEAKALDAVAADLGQLKTMIGDNADLQRFIRSPLIDRHAQTRGMLAVLDAAKVQDLVRRFVGVVGGNRRLFALPGMIDAFLRELARRRGQVTVHVTTAAPLSPLQQATLSEALKRSVGQTINIEATVDPKLIGGLVLRVGSRMIDTSIQTQLQKLQRAMRAA